MPAQRTTEAVSDARRSAFPQIDGVPSWAAVLIAVTATLLGFAIEAGSGRSELGTVFAVCYAVGCIAAVLAVRQSGIFTAVIQPPLLLFVAVPLAYFLMHGDELSGLKGFLITCGYPLIERFPLMLLTAAAVLVIGLARWYLPSPAAPAAGAGAAGLLGGVAARLFARSGGRDDERPRHRVDRSATGPSRAARPARDDPARAARARRGEQVPPPGRHSARRPAGEERSRQRPAREPGRPEPARRVPRERRDPREDYDGYQPRPSRAAGYESRDGYSPRRERAPRRDYQPRGGYESDPYPPRPPRPRPERAARPRSTDHHPVSRVRYRGEDPGAEPREPRGF